MLAAAGCGKEPADPVAAVFAKKPAFLRIFNAGDVPFTATVNGAPFGSVFESGDSNAPTRIPGRTVTIELTSSAGKSVSHVIEAEPEFGYSVFVFNPESQSGIEAVPGDVYQAPKGEALVRGVVLKPTGSYRITLAGRDLVAVRGGSTETSEAVPVQVGQEVKVELHGADGKVIATARIVPESERSYTVLTRHPNGKPRLEVLVNNPPLVPRGPLGFANSN